MTKTFYNIILASCLIVNSFCGIPRSTAVTDCPDLQIIFARGSGEAHETGENFLEFKSTLEQKLNTTSLKYDFIDLDYEAIGIGLDHLDVSLGAIISGGESYDFGNSVNDGVAKLTNLINNPICTNTQYIIGGYSQGAMVISKSLASLNSNHIIYAATFGDPKLYLPEGAGIIPDACKNENLSNYRNYVPDCHAYEGILGGYNPYEPLDFAYKVGTWCNKMDIVCSSYASISDHVSYISDALYEDASRVIFAKIANFFHIQNTVKSPHDTAILIDSTGSMLSMLNTYKQEALKLAEETFESGGRVALYDYRDLADPYQPVEHCGFETCTMEIIESELNKIRANGGGDVPESLLSASLRVMNEQNWKYGSTKSLVILTDANYLSPDRDGTTIEDVVKLSKTIDPVNFYIITSPEHDDDYQFLAEATDGGVRIDLDGVLDLTEYIIERYDSLPRVEESSEENIKPKLTITSAVQSSEKSIVFNIETTGTKTLIILNDQILGATNQTTFTITDLDLSQENIFRLVPITNIRGEAAEYILEPQIDQNSTNTQNSTNAQNSAIKNNLTIQNIKAPNTGAL